MATGLPKIGFKMLSLYVSELVLRSDGSDAWVEDPQILAAWHRFFFCTMLIIVAAWADRWVFTQTEGLALLTGFLRVVYLGFSIVLTVLAVDLAQKYYRLLLIKGKDLRFSSIATFWAVWVACFALVHRSLYTLQPTLYALPHPVQILDKPVYRDILYNYQRWTEFLVYSAASGFSVTTPGIASASYVVTALNVAEVIGVVLLVAVVVATFAGHMSKSSD